jgi:hypothetical protein
MGDRGGNKDGKEQATANQETERGGTKEAGQGPAKDSVAGSRHASIPGDGRYLLCALVTAREGKPANVRHTTERQIEADPSPG